MKILNNILSFISMLFTFLFGKVDSLFFALIIFIILDYITGLIKSYYLNKLNSAVGFKGILKKMTILIVVMVGHLIDTILKTNVCTNLVIFFYISNESLSIIENLAKIGLPLPKKLIKVLEQLNEKSKEE